jgi:pyruvate dehydrogenase E2 component (dihydrolipoamide acetyltransferase)
LPTEVIMPALGMAQETGKLVRWFKREGEAVTKGEPLMEVETDKAAVEVESPATGTLAAITATEGEDITVGLAVAMILAPGESLPAAQPKSAAPSPPKPASPAPETVQPGSAQSPVQSVPAAPGRTSASPKARRLAEERGVDLSKVAGSGPGGAILEEDVLQASEQPAAEAKGESALWRAMAANVTRSWKEAPHFFVIREADAGALAEERRRSPDGVTYTDLLLRRVALALVKHPRMNGGAQEVNIGLAVAVPDGLMMPVIHGVDRLPVQEIASNRKEVLDRVRSGHLRSSDVSGGTFTVSNLGMYDVDVFTAILTEGQAGILAVGRIDDRVVARDGAAVVRPTMLMSLSCDHRRVDGARAAEFMQTLVGLIESASS